MNQEEFELLKLQAQSVLQVAKQLRYIRGHLSEIRVELAGIAEQLEKSAAKEVSPKSRLESELSWLKWCYAFFPSEATKAEIDEMSNRLKMVWEDEVSNER